MQVQNNRLQTWEHNHNIICPKLRTEGRARCAPLSQGGGRGTGNSFLKLMNKSLENPRRGRETRSEWAADRREERAFSSFKPFRRFLF